MNIKFSDYKEKLLKALNDTDNTGIIEKVKLMEGFINQPVYNELTGSFIVGGPTIPMVALIGDSGRIYFYALKALLPEIEL